MTNDGMTKDANAGASPFRHFISPPLIYAPFVTPCPNLPCLDSVT